MTSKHKPARKFICNLEAINDSLKDNPFVSQIKQAFVCTFWVWPPRTKHSQLSADSTTGQQPVFLFSLSSPLPQDTTDEVILLWLTAMCLCSTLHESDHAEADRDLITSLQTGALIESELIAFV